MSFRVRLSAFSLSFKRYIALCSTYCGNAALIDPFLPKNYTDLQSDNLLWGLVNFNSFPNATLALFSSLTAEGWTDNVYLYWDATNPLVSTMYFTILIVFGTFFLMNLVLAILYNVFHNIATKKTPQTREEEGNKTEKAGFQGSIMSKFVEASRKPRLAKIFEVSPLNKRPDEQVLVEMQEVLDQQENPEDGLDQLSYDLAQTVVKISLPQPEDSSITSPKLHSSAIAKPDSVTNHNQLEAGAIEEQKQHSDAIMLTMVEDEVAEKQPQPSSGSNSGADLHTDHLGNSDSLSQLEGVAKSHKKHSSDAVEQPSSSSVQKNQNGEESNDTIRQEALGLSENDLSKSATESKSIENREYDHSDSVLKNFFNVQLSRPSIPEDSNKLESKRSTKSYSVVKQMSQQFSQRLSTKPQQLKKDGCWLSYRKLCSSIVFNPCFSPFIMLLIVTNLVVLAYYQYPMALSEELQLDEFNRIFTWIFLIELLIRLSALGARQYFNLKFNIFDTFIVFISLLVELMEYLKANSIVDLPTSSLKALRTARFLRVFRLAQAWEPFLEFLKTLKKTFKALSLFLVLLLLFMIIGAICGEGIFAYRARFDDDGQVSRDPRSGSSPRVNFDDFPNAMIAMFAILANDDWNQVMYRFMRTNNSLMAKAFFVGMVVFGNIILLQLFLAILIGTFDEASQHVAESSRIKHRSRRAETLLTYIKRNIIQLVEKFGSGGKAGMKSV